MFRDASFACTVAAGSHAGKAGDLRLRVHEGSESHLQHHETITAQKILAAAPPALQISRTVLGARGFQLWSIERVLAWLRVVVQPLPQTMAFALPEQDSAQRCVGVAQVSRGSFSDSSTRSRLVVSNLVLSPFGLDSFSCG